MKKATQQCNNPRVGERRLTWGDRLCYLLVFAVLLLAVMYGRS